MSRHWGDEDQVRRIDTMPASLVHDHYDRVHRTLADERRERRRARLKSRLLDLAVVLAFILLLALAGGIERTGW